MRHFLKPSDLNAEERISVLNRARELKALTTPPTEQNLRVGGLYFNPSLRTRISWEQACWRLGASCQTINAGADSWKMEMNPHAVMDQDKQENIVEAAGVLGRYFHLLGVRSFPGTESWDVERTEPTLSAMCQYAGVPIVSLEGAMHHPCQSLADELTIREHFGNPEGLPVALVWAWHPNPLPMAVPQSFALQTALAGCDLRIVRPDGYDLDPEVMDEIRATGSKVTVTNDRAEGLKGVKVAYVKSWGSMPLWGQTDAEREFRSGLRDWQFDRNTWNLTDEAKVMHCLPVRRNVVLSGEMLESEHSLVFDEAENRLWAQAALIEHIAKREGLI
ncbi:MAG: N-acetylornithine carbamoyltransferase [Armatimonadetes bacterium]|nr:N-acetylornithine carbamoyltransferase [Armatimonadota bacterium]